MIDPTASHSQQSGLFAKAWQDQTARLEAFYTEWSKIEGKMVEQATTGIEESTRLSQEAFSYVTSLSAQWRKLALEGFRRASEMMAIPPRA
ncbi:MAG: hypothetical protein NVS3B20_14270 [Polyangiales bacterium]